ncbi:phosphohistidine phosphatase SixA [Crocosphaera sp. XPORK-15E]|uniref:phosphohistidine phosphatase SixA n=1 Tax=Crocosphaera sp. XPORK-15E TaxID=3110247 RepID=UPI002B20EC3B|nr:phosphohistidine phosphatase SixA [Crocosphaera sp. XPORK-15E]MEA5534331.1 phosphohistidine phosphatase SixA [Crocosphaera sp. XPORK-15E]
MTQLYLIRHGIAVERENDMDDKARPLTEIGREKTLKVAQRLRAMGINFDLILTSSLVRARQTAEILQTVGLSDKLEEFSFLAPGGDIDSWADWWANSHYNKPESCLALVGHQPDLGDWAEILVWGNNYGKLVVKKAGIIGINLPDQVTPIGQGELFLLTSPKWLI